MCVHIFPVTEATALKLQGLMLDASLYNEFSLQRLLSLRGSYAQVNIGAPRVYRINHVMFT